jgi:1-aminocyclopropane-1-carboxylate deaminase
MFGMRLEFTDRESYRDKQSLFQKLYSAQPSTFFIDEGGASAEGVQGCSELTDELGREYDYLFCACGTGTTAAGIINGLRRSGCATSFEAVAVLKDAGFLEQNISAYLTENSDFKLHLGYHFGGYAKTTPELIRFIMNFSATTGILLDPVYTGKLFYSIYDLAKQDYFKPGSSILAIHTGGLFGLLGMMKESGFDGR